MFNFIRTNFLVIALVLVLGFYILSTSPAEMPSIPQPQKLLASNIEDLPPPCEVLPDNKTVDRVISENTKIISKVENVNPGRVFLMPEPVRCPGKADIIIKYQSETDKDKIENILGSTFFSIPYRYQRI